MGSGSLIVAPAAGLRVKLPSAIDVRTKPEMDMKLFSNHDVADIQELFDEYPSVVLCVTHHPRIVANIFGSRWQDVLQAFDEVSEWCQRMPVTRLSHMRTAVVLTKKLQS